MPEAEFLQAFRRSTAPALGETKPRSGEEHLRRPPDGAVGFLHPIQASSPQSLRDSRLKAEKILPDRRKFDFPGAIGAEGALTTLAIPRMGKRRQCSKARDGVGPILWNRLELLGRGPRRGNKFSPFGRSFA